MIEGEIAILRFAGLLVVTIIALMIWAADKYYKKMGEKERASNMHDPLEDGILFD